MTPSLAEPLLRGLPPAVDTWADAAQVVVVGTGAAGMSAALEAAGRGLDVLVVSKSAVGGGSTPLAQGGLAAVSDPGDSPCLHAEDTRTAGAGLCDADAVDALVDAAPREIARLSGLGARWDGGPLGLEGGHHRRRIVHAGGDASGAEVHRVLAAALAGAVDAGRIRLWEDSVALDALLDGTGRVAGVRVGRMRSALRVGSVATSTLVIATGGFGHAFSTTTNPDGVTGDGLALAARAGAEICDVEFIQFHPTVMWRADGRGRRPLLTEALRGAGATIVDAAGRRVMAGVHPLADLAPRDVVSAAMHQAMAASGSPCLWLDATVVGRSSLEHEFPTVTAACRAAGIDPVTDPVPIAPGAHYACGGIRAGMDGSTSVEGLFAIGEAAATGVHGANRLASNSLTESLATGRLAGRRIGGAQAPRAPISTTSTGPVGVEPGARARLAEAMSRHAGVVRHGEGLEHLLQLLGDAPPAGALDLETIEATNLHTVSTLVAAAALARTESRGCHRRSDAPATDPAWEHHLVLRSDGDRITHAAPVAR